MKGLKISQSITDRQDASLSLFFKDVSKIPLLDQEEESDLARKAKDGDQTAMDKLVTSNLRFVISVAKQYQGKGLPLVDLIQSGTIGIIEASKRFDPDKGYKFISFAVWWIRQAIIKALSDQCRTVRVPMSQILSYNKVNRATEKFEQEHGRKPSIEELEQSTELSADKINSSMVVNNKSISLDSPFKDEEVNCLMDVIPNDNAESADSDAQDHGRTEEIERILNKLPYRDGDVIKMSFGIGMPPIPHDEIAKKFGVGSERIRQIQRDTLLHLAKYYSKELKELL